jgi:DNA polymerase III alpha subunit
MVENPEQPSVKHNLLVEYARRVRGLPGSKDILPLFNELLPETYGLIVFQEGLQKVYQNLTGCTGAEAEAFRRLSAKKKPEEMVALYQFFMDTAGQKVGLDAAKQIWSGLLEFSAYSFNMAHSVGYVVIGYACAWLKHHYPLEWWSAVLTNATKDEINEKFLPYVRDIVDLPDIKLSDTTWKIVNGRLRAPIGLCYGIGETAQAQINKYAPYESKEDFCAKIVQHRKDTADGEGNPGRSAITAGTMYVLFVSGIMDSLFDPTLSINERMKEFEDLVKKFSKEVKLKYSKKKADYETLDAIGRYQTKKNVLPAYSEDLSLITTDSTIEDKEGKLYYKSTSWSRLERAEVESLERVVGFDTLKAIDTAVEMPQCGYQCAIVGYVENKETFSYKEKTRTAKKFLIDSCGFKAWMVYWPDSDGMFPKEVESLEEGSVIVGLIAKTDLTKGFSFRNLKVLRTPPKKMKEEAQ